MSRKPRSFSILIVPDDENKTLQFKIKSLTFKLLLFTLVIFLSGILFSVIYSGRIAAKIQLVNYLAKKNKELKEENRKIEELSVSLSEIKSKEDKIRRLASTFINDHFTLVERNKPAGKTTGEADAFISYFNQRQKSIEQASINGHANYLSRMAASIPTLRPLNGWITRRFNSRKRKGRSMHSGVDIAALQGAPIVAAASGIVTFSGRNEYFGNMIRIHHGFGFETLYGHNSALLVHKGDLVIRGQNIAMVGNTGRSAAPHLHYEIKKNGIPLDPMLFIVK